MRLQFMVTVLVLLCLAGTATAQMDAGAPPADMGDAMGAGGMDALACPMCGRGMGGPGMGMMGQMSPQRMLPMLVQQLGLTDQQIMRLTDIWLDYAKTSVRLNSEIQVRQLDLLQMLVQDRVDRARVESTVREISQRQGDLMLAGAGALLQARDVLTAEQWQTLRSMLLRMAIAHHGGGPAGPTPARPGAAPGPSPGGHAP